MAYDYQDLVKIQIEIPDFKGQAGDIHTEFDKDELRKYIKTFGSSKLVNKLVRMTNEVIEIEREIENFYRNEDDKANIIVT